MRKINIYFFLLAVFSSSCLDNENIVQPQFSVEDTIQFIKYVEENGDYPNNILAPALVKASTLWNNLSHYIIIDIRNRDDFLAGHIQTAVNISTEKIINYIDSVKSVNNNIVIVCSDGQKSTYIASLLRIAGYNNIFSLKYGMASWHHNFADIWFENLKTAEDIITFSNTDFPMNPYSELPSIYFPSNVKTIEEKINFRINSILLEGFNSKQQYISDFDITNRSGSYLVCYGPGRLYYAPRNQVFAELGHPNFTTWYSSSPVFDFRSTLNLQTLPKDLSIILYSTDGHLSACMVAYLRFIGYDAKTLLFGANQIFYPRILADPELYIDAFTDAEVMDYSYVSGEK